MDSTIKIKLIELIERYNFESGELKDSITESDMETGLIRGEFETLDRVSHDLFNILIDNPKIDSLSMPEFNMLKEFLGAFERATLKETSIDCFSGGFANADLNSHNDKEISIVLKWGVQKDCEDTVHTEYYFFPRKTLKMSVDEIFKEIHREGEHE